MGAVEISIVTPTFNALSFLKRCCRSVADQEGVRFEHIVQDGGSTDGTVEWLAAQPGLIWASEKDEGPHDAENRGFLKARGEILAYLNADEQYLPGTLRFVRDYFRKHPGVDMLFGDFLTIRPDGTLLAYRKGFRPWWPYMEVTHLYLFTCTMFFRRKIFDAGFRFRPELKFTGDHDFVIRVLRAGYRARHVRRYMAAYVIHAGNMSASEAARAELWRPGRQVPRWVRVLKYPLRVARLLEKAASGAYWERMPIVYAIYPDEAATERQVFVVSKASPFWRRQ